MASENLQAHTFGWIGTGKMGYPMAERLIGAGVDVSVYNRTKAKAEPLGIALVDTPADLADRDIVYTIVTDDAAFRETVTGANGVFSRDSKPKILIDSSTVSPDVSEEIRAAANAQGVQFLAAPISGNGRAVAAGKASLGVSGPRDAYDTVNLRIGLEGERWSVTVWGRNITDEEYLEEIIPAIEFGGSFIHPARLATYGADFSLRF